MNNVLISNVEREQPYRLYEQWKDALLSPTFDADQLRQIHAEYQAKLQRDAEWARLWDECDGERRAEEAEIEQRVRAELQTTPKSEVFKRWEQFCDFGDEAGRVYAHNTKEDMLHTIVQHEQRVVVGTIARTRAKWNELHPEAQQ
ncbi:MAG: hypothetical protein WCF84_02165 [Anaerolineae bacterium]